MLVRKGTIFAVCAALGGDPVAITRRGYARYRKRGRLERPDLQPVYGVTHIHGQVDSLDDLGVVEVVDRDGCGGGASGDQTFAQEAQTPSERLSGVILGKV